MSLRHYRAKRDTAKSLEPRGSVGRSPSLQRSFVIQKHAASHLHYDFRLEIAGVLKSWAIPKGPSMNPRDKRLAVMVEDHPLEYASFEGVIPKGNYGAGTVMVWDRGTFEGLPQDTTASLQRGLKAGKIEFRLHGQKMQGIFALVRLKGSDKNWLLIKKRDDLASESNHPSDISVITKRTLDEISGSPLKPLKKSPLPRHIKPMLATLVDQPFDDPHWLFEIKWDGFRAIAEIQHQRVSFYSRNQLSFIDKFPSLVQAFKSLRSTVVLDGEVVILDEQGRSRFQLLQNYNSSQEGTPVYYVFDLLYLDGRDLRTLPLIERKTLLEQFLQQHPHPLIRYSSHVFKSGKAFFRSAKSHHLEGIIGKRVDSLYVPTRSREWCKIKTEKRQEAVICGFTAPRRSRLYFGSLLLGVYSRKKLRYIGHVGTGFNARSLKEIHNQLSRLTRKTCPFEKKPKSTTAVTWVKPKLLCEVTFSEWTSDGQMRHPSFQGLRVDKNPKNVEREKSKKIKR